MQSIKASNRLKDPNDKFGKPSKSWAIEYTGITFKSSWESDFAILCDQNNIIWQYEPKTFILTAGHRYTPDFYLPQHDLYIEIKPEYRLHELKFDKMIEKVNYLVLTEYNRSNIISLL